MVKTKSWLPTIKTQCIHVEEHYDDQADRFNLVRCLSDRSLDAQHGWLCREHSDLQSQAMINRLYTPVKPAYRDRDQEVVDSIIAYETRMLRNVPREIIRVGAKTKLECVATI